MQQIRIRISQQNISGVGHRRLIVLNPRRNLLFRARARRRLRLELADRLTPLCCSAKLTVNTVGCCAAKQIERLECLPSKLLLQARVK